MYFFVVDSRLFVLLYSFLHSLSPSRVFWCPFPLLFLRFLPFPPSRFPSISYELCWWGGSERLTESVLSSIKWGILVRSRVGRENSLGARAYSLQFHTWAQGIRKVRLDFIARSFDLANRKNGRKYPWPCLWPCMWCLYVNWYGSIIACIADTWSLQESW